MTDRMVRLLLALVSAGCVLVGANALSGTELLRMQVSPAVARAPALVTVRVTVEAAAENRLLQVVAESPTFYRSSEVPIDGRNASPLQVFEFRNLPTGLYQITGVLVGTQGPRAMVSRLAKVESAPGSR
jgi:hypothetical protein